MTVMKLTDPRTNGTALRSRVRSLGETRGTVMKKTIGTVLMAAMLAPLTAGCINVQAPDEPIVIQLNIDIRQEVIYRLAEDAANTIDENADIF